MALTGLIADKNMNPITDPSPIDMVEDLKNLDDITLTRYAQDRGNPNATYALVVLMQRKNARDKAQTEAPSNTTVAEDIAQDITGGGIANLQPTAPMGQEGQGVATPPPSPDQLTTQGVGSLPAPNIGQNYAGGGIVAFQDGGNVFDPYARPYTSGLLERQGQTGYGSNIQDVPQSKFGKWFRSTFLPPRETSEQRALIEKNIANLQREIANLEVGPFTAVTEEERRQRLQKQDELKTALGKMESERERLYGKTEPGGYEPGTKVEETTLPTVEKPSLKEQAEAEQIKKQQEGKQDTSETPLADQIAKEKVDTGITQGLDQLRAKYTEDKGVADYAKDVEEAQATFGIDKDMYTSLAEEVKRDRENIAQSKAEAGNLALIEAGLMIAGGTSPNSLTNLKEAAPAVRNFAESVKGLRAEDRALKTMEFQIQSADAAIKQGRADKALAMLESNRNRSLELDKLQLTTEQNAIQKELDRQNNILVTKLVGDRPDMFEKQLAAAQRSGQYNDKDGKFNFTKFYSDYKTMGRTSSAGIDEDTIVRAFATAGGEMGTGQTYQQFKQQFVGGSGNAFSGFSATLIQ